MLSLASLKKPEDTRRVGRGGGGGSILRPMSAFGKKGKGEDKLCVLLERDFGGWTLSYSEPCSAAHN